MLGHLDSEVFPHGESAKSSDNVEAVEVGVVGVKASEVATGEDALSVVGDLVDVRDKPLVVEILEVIGADEQYEALRNEDTTKERGMRERSSLVVRAVRPPVLRNGVEDLAIELRVLGNLEEAAAELFSDAAAANRCSACTLPQRR